ncbi:MAG: hypothetical protein NTX59_13745 [Elusimicrobia bacterium]|nr:hypothetical protein [Elusimicrobiota bacterium]
MPNPPIRILLAALCLAFTRPAQAQSPDKPPAGAPAVSSAPIMVGDIENELKRSDIEIYTKVTGIATAQDTYDVLAPFDGRIEEITPELFDFVTPENAVTRLVSTEMAALLDATTPEERKQTERRWKDVYKYYDVKPENQGIVLNIYVQPKARVYKGDRLFTVARKIIIVGKTTDPLYSPLAPGITADMLYSRDEAVKLKTTLTSFMPIQSSPLYNRIWLEAMELRSGIKIGERFNGYMFVARSENTHVVPKNSLIDKNGRKYLILEVETGLATATEIEIRNNGLHYLSPAGTEQTHGKDKKAE